MKANQIVVLLAWGIFLLVVARTSGWWWAIGAAPLAGALMWVEYRDLAKTHQSPAQPSEDD